jgi:hypothetical protein
MFRGVNLLLLLFSLLCKVFLRSQVYYLKGLLELTAADERSDGASKASDEEVELWEESRLMVSGCVFFLLLIYNEIVKA